MADEKIRLSQKEVKTFNALKGIGGVHFPVFKDNTNYYKLPLSEIEELVASGVTTTVSEITEDTTVTLVAGQNRYLNCTNAPTISVEIADNNIYHLQINGSCTLALTGVSWGGDAITAITTYAEISILNGIAVGVLYE